MKIALDYDGTYTCDPSFWNLFIKQAQDDGHEVMIITKRFDNDNERISVPHGVVIEYTGRHSKLKFGALHKIDVWIDNNPFDITGYP